MDALCRFYLNIKNKLCIRLHYNDLELCAFLASGMSMFGGMTTTMIRSMIGKIVPADSVGKVFTFCVCIEVTVIPLVARTFFSFVYMSTQGVFPGAFSAISGVINAVVLLMIM